MSKLTVATKLADELGVSLAKAMRFIDDVGLEAATKTADDLVTGSAKLGSGLSPTQVKAILAGTATAGIGSGALIWRQQDVEKLNAWADSTMSLDQLVGEIMDDDTLTPEQKQHLIDQLLNKRGGGSGDTPGEDWYEDPLVLVGAIVLLAVVANATLGGGR